MLVIAQSDDELWVSSLWLKKRRDTDQVTTCFTDTALTSSGPIKTQKPDPQAICDPHITAAKESNAVPTETLWENK